MIGGSVTLGLSHPIAVSPFYDNPSLERFVMVDEYNAAGGGIVLEAEEEQKRSAIPGDFEEALFSLSKRCFPHRF